MGYVPAIPTPSSAGRQVGQVGQVGQVVPICVIISVSYYTPEGSVIGTGADGAEATTFDFSVEALPRFFYRLSSPFIARAGSNGDCRLNCKKGRGKESEERHQHLRRRRQPSSMGPPPSTHPFIQVVNGTGFHPATAACIGASRHFVQAHVKSLNHYKDLLS